MRSMSGALGRSAFLDIPASVQEIVVEGDDAPVVQDHGTVVPGDGQAPPLVVDAPTLPYGLYPAGRTSLEAYEERLTVLSGPDVHGPRPIQGEQAWGVAHGSKLRSAWRRSGIRDHGSTSTTR